MRSFNFCLFSTLSLGWFWLLTTPVNAQSGTQSDVTVPNPINHTEPPSAGESPGFVNNYPKTTIPGNRQFENNLTDNQNSRTETENIREEQTANNLQVDRSNYDKQLGGSVNSNRGGAIELQEEFQAVEVQNYFKIALYGNNPPPQQIALRLSELSRQTGKKTALIYVTATKNGIFTFVVFPQPPQIISQQYNNNLKNTKSIEEGYISFKRVPLSRANLLETVKEFQEEVSDEYGVSDRTYLESSQQLYQWLVAPIEAQLKAQDIDILVFAMDTGLRTIPLAALHDGKQFLIEKYAVAIIPSFGLTDVNYIDVRKRPILAMGASQFLDKVPLPAVPVELATVIENPRSGEKFLNEQFTIDNFKLKNQKERFSIIHLGTHAEFQPGDLNKSYIQFYDNRLSMSQLMQLSDELGWSRMSSSPVELLVLSACQTALGDREAELGFAGLAVAAGVKSVLASLWNVSDLGTLGLMSQFYQEYDNIPNKAEALRKAQLAMLQKRVRVKDGIMILENGEKIVLPEDFPKGNLDFAHPYYWASFTLIGNWN
jgi:CHAT domain-containing protein